MEAKERILANTFAQYTKAVINLVLALYSTRLILDALNVSDYGIFSVIGGIISMLGFITNALVITTQRFISYNINNRDKTIVRNYFNNSLFLHLLIGTLLLAIFFLSKSYIFDHWLNIEDNRIEAAYTIYNFTAFVLFATIITAPFKALFIARENIIFIALLETIDAIVKLGFAIALYFVQADKLITYSLMIMCWIYVDFLCYSIYAKLKFRECYINFSRRAISLEYIKPLIGFAGWTTYGMGAIACRNQGLAIVLNHFFGTTINAAYGIANQVYGAISFVSTSILNAMNPQIMKAEGEHNRKRMLDLASKESKYSVILLSLFAMPVIVEMPKILAFWLKETPEDTVMFCRYILVAFIIDQLTTGLNVANQSLGKIRVYSILVYTPKLLSLGIFYIILKGNYGVNAVMNIYLSVEAFVAMIRIPYLAQTAGLSTQRYIRDVFVPLIPLMGISAFVSYLASIWLTFNMSFLVTIPITVLCSSVVLWYLTFTQHEKAAIIGIIERIKERL